MPLSYDETITAATHLLQAGRNPSASAIIDHLGHGSKSTALKHLDTWRQSLQRHAFQLPPTLPDRLLEPLETFWNAAVAIASSRPANWTANARPSPRNVKP